MSEIPTIAIGTSSGPGRRPDLWAAATSLEASFLSEMLQAAGLGEMREALGNGIGEAQFSDMLATEQAKVVADAGGIGLAEAIYDSLVESEG